MDQPPCPIRVEPAPGGWSRVTYEVSPSAVRHAQAVLNNTRYDWGQGEPGTHRGKELFFRIEPHWNDHVSPGTPRWHRGVSVWETPPARPESPWGRSCVTQEVLTCHPGDVMSQGPVGPTDQHALGLPVVLILAAITASLRAARRAVP